MDQDDYEDCPSERASSQQGSVATTGGDAKSDVDEEHHPVNEGKRTERKSTRSTRFRFKSSIRGRSRRALSKKVPAKSPKAIVVPVTSSYVWYGGTYWQAGDIVSLVDEDDNKTYFAQIRGFLTDPYCEKSACLTWLLPTRESPEDGSFDPATFILGPEEDVPRKLEYMEFVMHAPSDYYKTNSPFPTQLTTANRKGGYIWTRLGKR